jgi:hypothetical protein
MVHILIIDESIMLIQEAEAEDVVDNLEEEVVEVMVVAVVEVEALTTITILTTILQVCLTLLWKQGITHRTCLVRCLKCRKQRSSKQKLIMDGRMAVHHLMASQ